MRSAKDIVGSVAIITGAGRGIGYAIADALAREGAHVIIAELVEERGHAAAEQLRRSNYSASDVQLDVTQRSSCRAVVDEVYARHGHIDILVNNAGVATYGNAEDLAEQDWRRQIDVMLTGTFWMCQAVGGVMIRHAGGRILNIASVGGMGGWPLRAAYGAAKAGVINLTETLATEWAQHGIRVNCISPGATNTEMAQEAVASGVASLDIYTRRTPLGRLAEVDEIAGAAAYLLSARSGYVTGVNLRVDGGWVAWGNPTGSGFPPVAS